MPKLLVIKAGGSIITNKNSQQPELRHEIVTHISEQIKIIIDHGDYQIILVHGAGSFGHPLAKKYHLGQGFVQEQARFGFAETVNKMLELNQQIVAKFLEMQIKAISLPPHSFIWAKSKSAFSLDTRLLEKYLIENFTPILFGDMILDEVKGCSILSGDTLVGLLAKKLQAKKVIFLSDVDGVFNHNPKFDKTAKRIPFINDTNLKRVIVSLQTSNKTDTTGEMRGKILAIKNHLKNIEVYIASGFEKNVLKKIIDGGQGGTKLLFE